MNNLMRRSGIVALLCLVLSLMLVITACGGDDPVETTGAPETTAPDVTTAEPDDTTAEPDDTTAEPEAKVTYTITVKDTDGNPIANVSVQICAGETCIPGKTNAEGVATIEAVEDVYKASVTKADGYVFDATNKVDLTDNAATITLAKAETPVVPGDSIVITESIGSEEELEELELKANKPVTYTYTAPSNGMIGILVADGSTASIVINNKTTGKAGQTVNGVGSAVAVAKAGNTYEIVVSSTEDATIEFTIQILNVGDGSKESPFIIQNFLNPMAAPKVVVGEGPSFGMITDLIMLGIIPNNFFDNAVTVEIEAGETVWYNIHSEYFEINDPSVSVNYKGTLYPCSNGGARVFTVESEYVEEGDYVRYDLYLNGELLVVDYSVYDGILLGFSAAADTETEIALRNGLDLPYWVDSFEGPFTILPESGTAYELIPGSYAYGIYNVSVVDFDAEAAGFYGRMGLNGSQIIWVDEYSEVTFYLYNVSDEVQVITMEAEDVTALAGPQEIVLDTTYTFADWEETASYNNGEVIFYYEATEAGTFALTNVGGCGCIAGIQLNLNLLDDDDSNDGYGVMEDLDIEVEAGDVVVFLVRANTNFFTGELLCDDCAFSAAFTAASVDSGVAGDTSSESSTPELELQ